MLTETTVSKLREMRLRVMANSLKDQLSDPQFQNMAFEDRIGLLVDAEWNTRKNSHLNKLIRQANFSDPGACLENVEYLPDRGFSRRNCCGSVPAITSRSTTTSSCWEPPAAAWIHPTTTAAARRARPPLPMPPGWRMYLHLRITAIEM